MKLRTGVLLLAVLFASVAVAYAADDPEFGTWKLNEAKSKIAPGTPKNTTVVYAADGDSVKVTVDGVGTDGKPTHNEWIGKFDGKDYPVTGDSSVDARSYKKVDGKTLKLFNKKGGKVTTTGTATVSADGKTRTLKVHGTDPTGTKFESTLFYDKQ